MTARKHFGCSVEGCNQSHDAKGYCHSHYKRWKLHGDPLVVKCAPRGSGWVERGYQIYTRDGKHVPEHRLVAERALGKPLPLKAVVHHIDENRRNNDPSNLVVCPDNKYHRLIHQRLEAMKASGHYHWRKCPYCKKYDDPVNMREERTGYGPRYVHRVCSTSAGRVAKERKRVSI